MTVPALATRRTNHACFDPGTARQLDGFRDRLRHVRIALCDMDDTLLDGRKRFPRRTEQAVRRWLDAGYELVLATGRPPRRAREVSDWLNLRPMICYNGCWIEHRRHVQYRRQMSRETTQAVIRCLLDACPDLWMGIESHDVLYAAQPQDRWPHAVLCNPVDLDVEAAKIFCRFSHLTKAQLQAVRLTAPSGTRLMESAKYNLLQFMDQAADKAVAAAWWLDQNGMDMGNCIALGDDTNDVRLLSEAAIGIAMSDAVPDAVAASDITVRNSESEGVAIALTTILELAGPTRFPTAG